MTFQSRLREARDATGLKQRQLAERLGVHPITYCLWESKRVKRTPRDQTMLGKIAEALGVHVSWLLTGEGPRRKRKAA